MSTESLPEGDNLLIPWPVTRPFGTAVTAEGVQMVWDHFVVETQKKGRPQSIEERTLMAILRAVAAGMAGNVRMVNTADELDDMPIGSVVLDRDRDAWQKVNDGVWFLAGREGTALEDRSIEDYLPGWPLWEGLG